MTRALAVLLGFVGGMHIAAIDLAGRSAIPRVGIVALVFLGIGLGLLATALVRKRLPDRSPGGVEYYIVTGVGGLAGPVLVLVHAIPNMPAGALAPVLALSVIAAAAWPEIQRVQGAGYMLAAAALVAAAFLVAAAQRDELNWLLAAIAASLVAGGVHHAARDMRPVGEDMIQSITGNVLAAAVVTTLFYMAQGNVIDFSVDWQAGGSLVPEMVAFGLLEIGLCTILLRKSPIGTWAPIAAAAPVVGLVWMALVGDLRAHPMIWGAAVVLTAAVVLHFAGLPGRAERGR
jgi:drug/metabolite transporter (DMT)-like permease